jgi:hypothetical protein
VRLRCVKCGWERAVESPEQICACPACGSAQDVYLDLGMPVCRVCGEPTVPTSASNLGAAWDCPRGHYREVRSKYGGNYYRTGSREYAIDDTLFRRWRRP